MRNHQYVPIQLISRIGNLRSGETYKTTRKLLKNKLIVHVGKKYDGYKLTYLGYDYLALHTFLKRGVIKDVICKIGVGKQSDIYKCEAGDGSHVVLKLTRLGRRSFKTIKRNRQYINNRTSYNWLYLSRLSSMRQFAFMEILHEHGFPTPKPIDTNRHAIVMSLIEGDPLCNIKKIGQQCSVKGIFQQSLKLVEKFASNGLIHGDFNQFNLMINQQGNLTVIDFPQCISSNHPNAEAYFDRDVQCLYTFFDKMLQKSNREEEDGKIYINQKDQGFNVAQVPMPTLSNIDVVKRLDLQIQTKARIKLTEQKQLQEYQQQVKKIVQNKQQSQQISEEQAQNENQQQKNAQKRQLQLQQKIQEQIFKQDHITKIQVSQLKKQQLNLGQEDQNFHQLMNTLKQLQQANVDNKQSSEQSQDDEDEDLPEQFKGLTPYQIRIKIKEQKRIQRQKKKQQMSTQDYIKKALTKKKRFQKEPVSKGNYGAKKKAKKNAQMLKDGLQMGW